MISAEELLKQILPLNKSRKSNVVVELLSDDKLEIYLDADLYAEKAQAYWRLDKYSLCNQAVESALKINPINSKAKYFKASLCYKQKKYDEAIKLYNEIIAIEPDFAYPYLGLGNVQLELGHYDEASELYAKSIELDSQLLFAYHAFGLLYAKLREYDKAITFFNQAIHIDPDYSSPYVSLGNIYLEKKDYDKAKQFYNKAIEIDPFNPDSYMNMAGLFYRLKNYDEALTYYNKSIEIDPENATAYTGLGYIYRDLKLLDESIKNFTKAIEIDSQNVHPYNGLGNLYSDFKIYDKALESYNKALEIDHRFINAYNGLGSVNYYLNDYDEALNSYNKAIEIDHLFPASYYNRALIYEIKSDYDKALSDFNQFIHLTRKASDYFSSLAKSKVAELEKLIKDPDYTSISEIVGEINNLLLYDEECVTHYTSFSIAKELILNDSKFRLSEGTYLNDTSEGKELFNYLPSFSISLGSNDTIAKPFATKPFIGSFVAATKHDDLTLWRMYGKENKEEARGIAITIDRLQLLEKLKNSLALFDKVDSIESSKEEFSFYRVAYRNQEKHNTFIIPGASKRVEKKLNTLMDGLSTKVGKFIINKKQMIDKKNLLELLNGIAYLFKSAEYQYEHELRLVVKGTGIEKVINNTLSPSKVYIELVGLASLTKKITLGPKVEKADEWAATFYYSLDKRDEHPEIFISHLPFK